MKALQSLALKLARASLWPAYFLLLAYAARIAPWPRSLGILVSALLTAAAIGFFARDMLRWLVVAFRPNPSACSKSPDAGGPPARSLGPIPPGRRVPVALASLYLRS